MDSFEAEVEREIRERTVQGKNGKRRGYGHVDKKTKIEKSLRDSAERKQKKRQIGWKRQR